MSGVSLSYPLYDITNNQGSTLSIAGLAFSPTYPIGWPVLPSGLSWAVYNHSYNSDVVTVENLVQQSRQLGPNTLVHQASFINMRINAKVVLNNGYTQLSVQNAAFNQISTYFANNISFLSQISFTNLASQLLKVGGVANATVTSIDILSVDGTKIGASKTSDFILASNQLPNLASINLTFKGASNF